MKQTLDEQLSSLVDDELHGKERDFLIDQLKKDPAKQACWNRYHLIGDVMKEQVADYRLPDISQRVSLQLKNESVVIKPKQFFKKDFFLFYQKNFVLVFLFLFQKYICYCCCLKICL